MDPTDSKAGSSSGAASSTGGDTGGPPPGPDVIGPEICAAGQTTGGMDSDSDTSESAGTEGPDPTGASASGETGSDAPGASDDDKGCSVQDHRDAPVGAAALLMLGLFARRRRG